MMLKIHISLLTGLLFCLNVFTQAPSKKCSQVEAENEFLLNNPDLVPLIKKEEQKLKEAGVNYVAQKTTGTIYTIPIVFHILHLGGPENISDEQIHDAVRILNEDFRKLNDDIVDVIPAFQSITGDAEIQFRLAQKDPDGNCTQGINRYYTELTNNADDNSKINQWPRNMYLNVWVVKDIESGAGGYTYRPAFVNFQPWIDGIVILHTQLGSIGTSSPAGSRSLTHEIGHWINLAHTWGNTNNPGCDGTQTTGPCAGENNCNDDDGVSDTPNCIGSTSCNLNSTTCGSLDNIQNYMDYSFCENMFTQGQVDEMRTALTAPTAQRNQLITTSNLQATGTDGENYLCHVDFAPSTSVVCLNDTAILMDQSYNEPTSWAWAIQKSENYNYSEENPTVLFTDTGYVDIALTVTNDNASLSLTKTSVLKVLPLEGLAANVSEGFETGLFPNVSWTQYNADDDNVSWEHYSGTGYTGNNCIKLANLDNPEPGRVDAVISPLLDLSNLTSASLKFQVAFAQIDNSFDRLKIFVSKDCGQSWTLKTQRIGSNLSSVNDQTSPFTPSSQNDWKEISFTFSSSDLKERVLLKLEFEGKGGNNIYIDDINITGTFNEVPLLNAPEDEEAVNASTTIDWKAVGEADQYHYQVDKANTFDSQDLLEGYENYIDYSHWNADTEHDLSGLEDNETYFWRVQSITGSDTSDWSETWSFTVDFSVGLNDKTPSQYVNSMRVFPNPTNEYANIVLDIYQEGNYSLNLFDIAGKKVHALFTNMDLKPGVQNLNFVNKSLSSGVYYLRLEGFDQFNTQKIIISKD